MNQARIWLVVQPTVGLPLLLGSVTGLALLVHYAVLSHSTWYADYYQGGKHVKAAAESSTALPQVGELTLPNGAKVKFSIEGGSTDSVAFTAVPASSTVASVAASPSTEAPPLVRSDPTDPNSKSAN